MGTLTADCPRLDSHCPHKLATSCRLSSTPNCCACADERVHSRTYRVYIDGVGFVQRGTRWQGYCWFCKEFWSNRLASTDPPLEISQTRIPEIPDQTEFLERWWEFHQGYSIIKLSDGSEQRRALVGEPFKEVSPGFLPRTLDQLRAGILNDAQRPENRLRRRRLSSEEERPQQPQQSLEDALDHLLNEASEDEAPNTEAQSVLQTPDAREPESPEQTRPITRREARLQRARERFARVFGSREDVQQDDYESPLTQMYGRAYDRYRQAEERRAEGTTSAPSLGGLSAQERRDIEEQLLWGVMRESQTMSESLEREGDVWSYAPVHSNIEEVMLSGDGEPSTPLVRQLRDTQGFFASNFEAAQSDQLIVPQGASTTGPPGSNSMFYSFGQVPEAFRSAREDHNQTPNSTPATTAGPNDPITTTSFLPAIQPTGLSDIRTNIQQITSELQRLRLASEALSSARHSMHTRNHPEAPFLTLDNQPDRPPPKTDEEMTKTLACQVCYQQLADVAVLPCGHMVMCQWCADVVIPVRHSHLPVRPTKCPMCRKQVKQRFKIHMGS
ncbi:Nn.00g040920.m01.CDS01 [Neocucurbitaria sp. VM-36]